MEDSESLQIPIPTSPLHRPPTSQTTLPEDTPSFALGHQHKTYRHQYANIYFIRLRLLRDHVEKKARQRWKNVSGDPQLIPRVLEVVKGDLCFIIGTVYMDMPLKPNVMDDIARDHSIPPPPPREKFCSSDDATMLEDESGRIQLVGDKLKGMTLVTGIIMAALGHETPSGEFTVVDVCFAGLAPQASIGEPITESDEDMEVDRSAPSQIAEGEWIAVVSGLEVGVSSPADGQLQMLAEYLCGEAGGPEDQLQGSRISRLIIAGNSFGASAPPEDVDEIAEKKPRRYGYDATTFSPHATHTLGAFLLDIARVMPVHVLAGASDPSGALLPQQALPRAMFGAVREHYNFACETNPSWLGVAGRSLLVDSGQPLEDMFKYLPSPPVTRLSIATSTLRWRHTAPTAPDTLWCYPYFTADPFVLNVTPHVYIAGNQPLFATRLVKDGDVKCRVVLVPGFSETGALVLVNLKSLRVRVVQFSVAGMNAGGGTSEVPVVDSDGALHDHQ
ncbi:hypothetical protein BD410DRAFT_761860 [Rickenella mellea]|uniref:DNA-directed DNA polymerase n=1 Tax=Rickenella mellea TaxID=50990 RepID=A0A4Y7QJY7_9AGAM|nr:hypothetical protein BD410DRAFT_761860 [Rickenella mellea]